MDSNASEPNKSERGTKTWVGSCRCHRESGSTSSLRESARAREKKNIFYYFFFPSTCEKKIPILSQEKIPFLYWKCPHFIEILKKVAPFSELFLTFNRPLKELFRYIYIYRQWPIIQLNNKNNRNRARLWRRSRLPLQLLRRSCPSVRFRFSSFFLCSDFCSACVWNIIPFLFHRDYDFVDRSVEARARSIQINKQTLTFSFSFHHRTVSVALVNNLGEDTVLLANECGNGSIDMSGIATATSLASLAHNMSMMTPSAQCNNEHVFVHAAYNNYYPQMVAAEARWVLFRFIFLFVFFIKTPLLITWWLTYANLCLYS